MKTLARALFRYHLKKPLLTGICIIGVALGVTVVAGIQLANRSALEAFRQATATLNGKASHNISSPGGIIREQAYTDLVRHFPTLPAAPVISTSIPLGEETATLMGIDPLAEIHLRPDFLPHFSEKQLLDFLTIKQAVIINGPARKFIDNRGFITLALPRQAGKSLSLQVIGILDNSRYATIEPLILGDLSWIQAIYPGDGKLSRIDLLLENPSQIKAITSFLPAHLRLQSSRKRQQTLTAMLRSFELNITALSLLSLFVGFFLIYNTITFMVLQRRREMGILQALGFSRFQLMGALVVEVICLAALGSMIGVVWGYFLAKYSMVIISRTITDLYFSLQPAKVDCRLSFIFRCLAIGIGAGFCGVILPLREIRHSSIARLLSRRTVEDHARANCKRFAIAGLLLVLFSLALSRMPGRNPYFGFVAAFGICLGFALITPLMVDRLTTLFLHLSAPWLGIRTKLGIGSISRRLSRTAPAISALMVALAMSMGISLMIGSFRGTLKDWFHSNIQGDFYISGSDRDYDANTLNREIYHQLKQLPGVEAINRYRNISYQYNNGIIRLSGMDAMVMKNHSSYQFIAAHGSPWDELRQGKIMVSESFANKYLVKPGDRITLRGIREKKDFMVTAVYRDYLTEHGVIIMDYSIFSRFMDDREVNSLAIFLPSGITPREFRPRLLARLQPYPHILYTNASLRKRIMEIFDRSFTITISTRFIAVIVAFFGIISALLSIYLESEREYGILRALGLSRGDIFRLSLLQSLTMGLLAGFMAWICGPVLAWVLIKVINLKSFGWSIDIHLTPLVFLSTLAIAAGASLISGLYPAWRIAGSNPYFQMQDN